MAEPLRVPCLVFLAGALAAPAAVAAPTACTREVPCACDALPAAQAKLLFGQAPSGTRIEVAGSYDCGDRTMAIHADAVQVIGDLRVAAVEIEGASRIRIGGLTAGRITARRVSELKIDDVTLRGPIRLEEAGPALVEGLRFADDVRCGEACIVVGAGSAVLVREVDAAVPGSSAFVAAPAGAKVVIDRANLRGRGALLLIAPSAKPALEPMLVRDSLLHEFSCVVRLTEGRDNPPPQKLVLLEHTTVERTERLVDWGGERPCPTCAEALNSLFVHVKRPDGYYRESGADASDGRPPGALHAVKVEYGESMRVLEGNADRTANYGAPAGLAKALRDRYERAVAASTEVAAPAAKKPDVVRKAGRLQVRLSDGNNDGRAQPGELIALTLVLEHPDADLPAGTVVTVKSAEAGAPSFVAACFNDNITLGALPRGTQTSERTCRMAGNVPTAVEMIDVEVAGFSPAYRLQVAIGNAPAGGARPALPVPQPLPPPMLPGGLPDVDHFGAAPRPSAPVGAAALVIGVGQSERGISSAREDARSVAQYLVKLGGIPEQNLMVLTDAPVGGERRANRREILRALSDLKAVWSGGTAIVYLAGTGIHTGDSDFFVPADSDGRQASTLLSLDELGDALGATRARNVIVLADVSLDGRGDRALWPWSGDDAAALKRLASVATVITADGGAWELPAARHGLFTYCVLRGLGRDADADFDGLVTLGELARYVADQVPALGRRELGVETAAFMAPAPAKLGNQGGLVLARWK